MQINRLIAAALCLPITLCTVACLQSAEAEEPSAGPGLTRANIDPEPIGEAQQKWTKSECYTAWQYNMAGCISSPPNLRPACWAAASALLAACLAAAQ